MKNLIIMAICFGFFNGFSQGQNKRVDSLMRVLQTGGDDTARVNTLNALADEFRSNNPDTAVYFANEGYELAKKMDYKMGMANSFLNIGIVSMNLGDYEKAQKNIYNAIAIYDQLLKTDGLAKEKNGRSKILKQKARSLKNIGVLYAYQGNYTESMKFFTTVLKIYEEIGDKKGIADSYGNIGVTYDYQGNYSEALKNYTFELKIAEETVDKQGLAKTFNNIAIIYDEQGNYPEALKNHFSSLKFRKELGDKIDIASSYNNIGKIYTEQGNYPEALKNHIASMKLSEETGDKKGLSASYLNIGNVYNNQGNHKEALQNYFAGLKIQKELGLKHYIAYSYNNIGNVYEEEGDFPEALKYYSASLKIKEEIGDKQGLAGANDNIGIIYHEQGNYVEALKHFFDALKIKEDIGDSLGIANSCIHIGNTYLRQKKYSEASHYLSKGLFLSKEVGSHLFIKDSYLGLSALDSLQGNFKRSLENYKMYIAYRDSLVNEENTKKTVQIQMQYEFDKKESVANAEQEKKDAIALKELQKQKLLRNFFIGVIGLVLVLFFFVYRTYRTRQVLRLHDIRNKIAGDLHDDIGSTLNSISIYSEVARKKDENYDEALEMIGDASRKVIDAMSDIVWTINSENDSFGKIIFRMKSLAYNLFRAKNIEFTFHADEILKEKKLSLENRRNFYLIFKEAVNNLVKYANATRTAITLTNEDGYIRLRIQDDGVGFDTSRENEGNGLKNMKRRADEMKADLKLESKPGSGTQIELILKA